MNEHVDEHALLIYVFNVLQNRPKSVSYALCMLYWSLLCETAKRITKLIGSWMRNVELWKLWNKLTGVGISKVKV